MLWFWHSSRPTWPRQDHAGNRKRSHRHHAPCDTLLHSPPARAGSLQGMVARHQPCSCRCRHRSVADHRVHLHQSRDTCAGRSIHPCHGTTSQCRKYHHRQSRGRGRIHLDPASCHMPSRLRIRRSQNRMPSSRMHCACCYACR